uniref:Uncharacterized protein n=1 Tax=Oryza glumipatula TaxID=40148 RepID=A0A0E0AZZ6_9ORYZ
MPPPEKSIATSLSEAKHLQLLRKLSNRSLITLMKMKRLGFMTTKTRSKQALSDWSPSSCGESFYQALASFNASSLALHPFTSGYAPVDSKFNRIDVVEKTQQDVTRFEDT